MSKTRLLLALALGGGGAAWLASALLPAPARPRAHPDARLVGSAPVAPNPASALPRSQPAPSASTLDAVHAQMEALEAKLAQLSQRQEGEGPHAEQADPRPPTEREAFEQGIAQLALLDQALDEQPRDPAWSEQGEREVDQALRGLVGAGTALSAQCRTTLCRAELTHPDARGHASLIEHFLQTMPWRGAIQLTKSSEDGSSTVVFLAKPGHELPTSDG